MHTEQTPDEGELSKLIDEQLELAAAKLPALAASALHPSPADHDERTAAHLLLDDVLLGNAQPSAEMLEDLRLPATLPALSDDELARQALAGAASTNDPLTPRT